jgi:hypothetical protein
VGLRRAPPARPLVGVAMGGVLLPLAGVAADLRFLGHMLARPELIHSITLRSPAALLGWPWEES